MNAKPRWRVQIALFLLLLASRGFGDISGNFTLTSNQTFTSTSGTFTIGGPNRTFNLQTFTATFTGQGDFDINSSITGSGQVLIDMAGVSQTVSYDNGNSYSGLTTVRGGTLVLNSPSGANDGILGDLYIGGGLQPAVVTRPERQNRELIADTSTITISLNGTLEFNRAPTGNARNNDSLETFGNLILDGGTLLNVSPNTRVTTVNVLGSIQLISSSVIDLGVAMTMNVGDVHNTWWAPESTLTIRNWSPEEAFYVGQITPDQLAQIRFETSEGLMFAQQLADGQIIPTAVVPEASALLFVPLLAAASLWPELKRRFKNRLSQ